MSTSGACQAKRIEGVTRTFEWCVGPDQDGEICTYCLSLRNAQGGPRLPPQPMRLDYDDQGIDIMDKVNKALKVHGLTFEDDGLPHDGFNLYTLGPVRP
jgi:hypothetical protein